MYGRKTVDRYRAEFLALQLIASGLIEAFEKCEGEGEKRIFTTYVRVATVKDDAGMIRMVLSDEEKWNLVGKRKRSRAIQ